MTTESWQAGAALDVGALSSSNETPERFLPACFSPDGKHLVGLTVRKSRTARGEKRRRVVILYELDAGKRTEIELDDVFNVDDDLHTYHRPKYETATFSSDSRNVIVGVVNGDQWNKNNNRSEAVWTVASWNLEDKAKQFQVSGLLTDTGSSKAIVLAPGGEVAITLAGSQLRAWDIPRLVKLRATVDDGDARWAGGDYKGAFDCYKAILSDDMSWFVQADLPRIYSRCVDFFAKQGESLKGRGLVVHAQQSKMSLAPESVEGKKLSNRSPLKDELRLGLSGAVGLEEVREEAQDGAALEAKGLNDG